MFHQWPPLSSKDEAALARAQERCAASRSRRDRFLNAKLRTIGIDVAGLDRQVEEKRKQAEADKKERDRYNEWERILEHKRNTIVKEQRNEQALMFKNMKRTWDSQSDRTTRPEWDIHDPDNRARFLVETETEGGPDGALIPDSFGSRRNEDVKAYKKSVQKQHADDFQAQLEEKQAAEKLAELEAVAHAAAMDKLRAARTRVEDEEKMARKMRDVAVFEANQGLDEFRRKAQRKQRLEEKEAEVGHAENEAASAYLTECRGKEKGLKGKVVRQEWKGMKPEELDDIRRAQIQQSEENRRRREEEKAEDERCEEHAYRIGAHARAIHRDVQKERSAEARKLADVHRKQHEDFQKRCKEERDERLRPGVSNTWWPFEKSDR